MRTQIFRTEPLLVDGTAGVIVTKDMDGVDPFDLFVENVDIAASMRTKFGSKNANIRFVAIIDSGAYDRDGASGNDISVTITTAPDQTFSVDVQPSDCYSPYGGDVTINLACDSEGNPKQFTSDVIDLLNADPGFAAILRASRALGSDGSAACEAMAQTFLAGGSNAVTSGAVTVEVSPTGWPDFAGPWVADASAATAFGASIAAGAVKVWSSIDKPVRGLRVKATVGSGDTYLVVTAVVRKKGGV